MKESPHKSRRYNAAFQAEDLRLSAAKFELELTLELLLLKIEEFRKKKHPTQAELGARLGVHKAQISKL